MPGKKSSSRRVGVVAAAVVILVAIGAVVVFQTGLLGVSIDDGFDDELLPSIQLTGPIKAKHLKLAEWEITSLNDLSRRYGDLFSAMNMNLSLESKFAPLVVEQDTVMIIKLTCKAQSSEVAFRSREVRRSELVDHMQRSVKQAEEEFRRYQGRTDGKNIMRLVI